MNSIGDYCHPNLNKNYPFDPVGYSGTRNCSQSSEPCNSCCVCYENHITGHKQTSNHKLQEQPCYYIPRDNTECSEHVPMAPHDCQPPVCSSPCNTDNYVVTKEYSKASIDCCNQIDTVACSHQDGVLDRSCGSTCCCHHGGTGNRMCCSRKTSWTEPSICACAVPCNPVILSNSCEGDTGASGRKHPSDVKSKKVRFSDEVEYVDCDEAFANLKDEDVKELCCCCKEYSKIGKDCGVCKPVLVYELPEPKMEGQSLTQKDFHWHKTPEVEVPPWHPNIKDRWHFLDVPSLKETTYQCDYKPPPVVGAERDPVYLAPQREKRDPCEQLAEEYCSWKKTSIGPDQVIRPSNCCCDEGCQKTNLQACQAAQYKCHGDTHVCSRIEQTGPNFVLCEKGDDSKSRYWWQRTCCQPEKVDITKLEGVPHVPACPPYTTSYMHDYKHPKKAERERNLLGSCSACEYCARPPSNVQTPPCLCTKDPKQPFLTQRGGIIDN